MLSITAAVGVVAADCDVALVIEQPVKDMQGLTASNTNLPKAVPVELRPIIFAPEIGPDPTFMSPHAK